MKKKRDYTPLTREYFEKAGYDIKLEDREPLMPGLEPWKEWVAYLNRSRHQLNVRRKICLHW